MSLLNILQAFNGDVSLIELSNKWWFLSDIFRSLFFALDSLIYYLIPRVYDIALSLADIRTGLNQQQIVEDISRNLYTFFALAMFFRYAFALLTMIADPDKIEDKQKGLSKIVTNSIIAIVLTILMPTVFTIAYDVQRLLIGDNTAKNVGILNQIFYSGASSGDETVSSGYKFIAINAGTRIAKQAFMIFVQPVTESYGDKPAYEDPDIKSKVDTAWNQFLSDPNFDATPLSEFIAEDKNWRYAIGYLAPLSTVVGVYLLWTFIVFAIEVAVRSFKLFALQIISPVAIMTYIDPDSSSKGIFKKWVDECIKTYASIFFRIIVVMFILMILSRLGNIFSNSSNFWILLFIILGLASFINVAPKMFEEIFGYKSKDETKLGKQLLGAGLGIGVGAAIGGVGRTVSAARNGQGFLRSAGAGFGGLFKGGSAGGKGGFKDGFGFKGGFGVGAGYGAASKLIKDSKSYKENVEAKNKRIEDDKSRKTFSDYDSIVKSYDDEKSFGAGNEARFVSQLSAMAASGQAGAAQAAADLAKFTTLSDPRLKKKFMGDSAKRQANISTYTKPTSDIVNKAIDKEFEAMEKGDELARAQEEAARLQSIYSNDPNGNGINGKTNLENFKVAQDAARGLQFKYSDLQKDAETASKKRDAWFESPDYKNDAEKNKRVSRGKYLS